RVRALFSPLVELIELVGALLVLGVGVAQLSRGAISLGTLLAFVAYLSQLYSPVRGLGRLGTSASSAAASAERIAELLAEPATRQSQPLLSAPSRAAGAIRFEQVSFTYPRADQPALVDVSFAVEPGESVAVLGRTARASRRWRACCCAS